MRPDMNLGSQLFELAKGFTYSRMDSSVRIRERVDCIGKSAEATFEPMLSRENSHLSVILI